jgi:hypothetical protein
MDLVQGNPTEVKVVLASVATALSYFGLEDGAFHAVTGFLLLVVLAVKVAVIRCSSLRSSWP